MLRSPKYYPLASITAPGCYRLPDPVVPRLVCRLRLLALLAILGRIVSQRAGGQLDLRRVGCLRAAGLDVVLRQLHLRLRSHTAVAEIRLVRAQIIARRPQILAVGTDVIRIRTDRTLVLADVGPVSADIALVGPDVIGIRADGITILGHVGPVRLDVAPVGTDVVGIRADGTAVPGDVGAVRVDRATRLVDLGRLIFTGARLRIIVP